MAFRTKLDFSDNRQVKQNIETLTVLSGATSFGVPFSTLPSGIDISTSAQTASHTGVGSTFSGNNTTSVFSWGYPDMALGYSTLSAITPSNSATTQHTSGYTASTFVTIDGNNITTGYSGVTFNVTCVSMYDFGGGVYSGTVATTNLVYFSASTLGFTGRTIWVDVSGITRTEDLIVTNNPIIGATLTCIDTEGKASWIPASASTSGLWIAGTGLDSVMMNNGNNVSAGHLSVAEGHNSQAIGAESHAEGDGCIAWVSQSHAEGQTTQAWGAGSHAEGQGTIAYGDFSHAEGINTKPIWYASHAEGTDTISNIMYAYGVYTSGGTNNSKFELSEYNGDVTAQFPIGDALLIDDSGGNRVFISYGPVFVNSATFTDFGTYSATVITLSGNIPIPDDLAGTIYISNLSNPIVSGITNPVIYDSAHAEGYNTIASGWASHAEGRNTRAFGAHAHAEGYSTRAAKNTDHAEGYSTIAMGGASHAEGYNTLASGSGSHAEGGNTISSGEDSHAEGFYSIASGTYSHAEGGGIDSTHAVFYHGGTASGSGAHAEGWDTLASDWGTHAEGFQTSATTRFSHAEGYGTLANGFNAHAEGQQTIASGSNAHAEGYQTCSFNDSTHAEGWKTSATTVYSHSEGNATLASGIASHAEGASSIASGGQSHAEGYQSLASGYGSHAEGGWASFGASGGTASGNGSHAEGGNTIAAYDFCHSEGYNTYSYGSAAHAEGSSTSATTSYAHAEGYNTLASGVASHAEGWFTCAIGDNSHAGGFGSYASGTTSFVHGLNSRALGSNTVVFGNAITGATANTTYVDNLNIKTVGAGPGTSIGINGGGQVVLTTSDVRIKENISTLTNSLDKIKNLRGVTFQLIDREANGDDFRIGFIAQEVNQVVPELTFINKTIPEQYMGVHYGDVTALLVEAVKELASGATSNNYLQTQTILAEDNNIELNYSGTSATAVGGGITVLHGMGTDLSSELIIDAEGNWTTNNNFIPNKITLPTYTPSGSTDTNGNLGNVTRDDDYLYVRTSTGWKRTNLENF